MTDRASIAFTPWIVVPVGMVMGAFVFGVSIIGQGVWETGRMWG